MDLTLAPTAAGAGLAALAIAGGAPLFGDGLRTLRLRRALTALTPSPLADLPTGFVQVSGRVALESPLFGPLSGQACAGFRLEIRAGGKRAAWIDERRAFRLVEEGAVAQVRGQVGRWDLEVTGERVFEPTDRLTANLEALLKRSPEARWLRGSGERLTLVERALLAGHECHVVGVAQRARPFELEAEEELLKTGTDGVVAAGISVNPPPKGRIDPELWIDDGGYLDFLKISDGPRTAREVRAPGAIRIAGLVLGPLLSLCGLLYLAHAADALRAGWRF